MRFRRYFAAAPGRTKQAVMLLADAEWVWPCAGLYHPLGTLNQSNSRVIFHRRTFRVTVPRQTSLQQVRPLATVHTTFLLVAFIAIALQGISLWLAFFGRGLRTR